MRRCRVTGDLTSPLNARVMFVSLPGSRGPCWDGGDMGGFPCLVRVASGSGQGRYRLGEELTDRYLEFVAGRCRPAQPRAGAAVAGPREAQQPWRGPCAAHQGRRELLKEIK